MNSRFSTIAAFSVLCALALVCPPRGFAQAHEHGAADPRRPLTPEQKRKSNALVQVVREATERFRDVERARAEQYELQYGCVSGPDAGAMGMHFVNLGLVLDGEIDATHPEIVIYEPLPGGRVRLIGADYLVLAEAWDKTHTSAPELMGQFFHHFDAPNRFGLPPFYTLHVWAWKDSPTGTFVNWNTNVSCDAYSGPTP